MFEFLGLVMNFRPVQFEDFHEEQFHQPVPSQNMQRELLATGRKPNPGARS